MQSAQQSIQSVAEAVGLRLKPLDKKAEKALVQAQQQDLKAQLAKQMDPAAALSLAVPLLVMQVRCQTCPHQKDSALHNHQAEFMPAGCDSPLQ